jgi:hypothetical protein
VARTGRTLKTQAFTGSAPNCKEQMAIPRLVDSVPAMPPWRIYGSDVKLTVIDDYAKAVGRQAAK